MDKRQMILELAEYDSLHISLSEAMEVVLKWFIVHYAEMDEETLSSSYYLCFGETSTDRKEVH